MTIFMHQDRSIFLSDSAPEFSTELPNGTYGLRFDPNVGLFLEKISPFEMPEKIYGNINERAQRIIKTFNERKGVTGVLLDGEKGSGKTLLGKKVAIDLQKAGQPIIVINAAFTGDMLGTFLQRLNKPVTLFFDEFEKIFSDHDQEGLLTLLDGVYPFKALAIITSNDSNKIADPLINRPGRVYYSLKYEGLDYDFAREYTVDRLVDQSRVEEVMQLFTMATINFDQLKALIEEMNRYNESAKDAVQMLNIDTDFSYGHIDIVGLSEPDGSEVPVQNIQHTRLYVGVDRYVVYKTANVENVTYDNWRHNERFHHYLSNNTKLDVMKPADVMPFIPHMIDLTIAANDDASTGTQVNQLAVSVTGPNRLKITASSGHVIHALRSKKSYKKSY